MKKLLCLFLLSVGLSTAVVKTVPQPNSLALGYIPLAGSVATVAVSATAWGAFSFVAPASPFSGTMRFSDITVYVSAVSGSPKLTATLYSDSAGLPNAAIEAGAESAELSATTWNTLTGFTAASNLTPGTLYWVVLACTTGTSATVVYGVPSNGSTPRGPAVAATAVTWNHSYVQSADGGGTWAAASGGSVVGVRFGLTDGTDTAYFGEAISSWVHASAAAEKLYTNAGTAQEYGSRFTSPSTASLKVAAIAMQMRSAGPPAGNLVFKLYSGAGMTLLGTTRAIPTGNVKVGGMVLYRSEFATPVTIPPGTLVSVTAANTAADDSTHYHATHKVTVHDDANSRALMPFGGIVAVTNTGGSWATVNGEAVPFMLYLSTGSEFPAGASGGSYGWVQ